MARNWHQVDIPFTVNEKVDLGTFPLDDFGVHSLMLPESVPQPHNLPESYQLSHPTRGIAEVPAEVLPHVFLLLAFTTTCVKAKPNGGNKSTKPGRLNLHYTGGYLTRLWEATWEELHAKPTSQDPFVLETLHTYLHRTFYGAMHDIRGRHEHGEFVSQNLSQAEYQGSVLSFCKYFVTNVAIHFLTCYSAWTIFSTTAEQSYFLNSATRKLFQFVVDLANRAKQEVSIVLFRIKWFLIMPYGSRDCPTAGPA